MANQSILRFPTSSAAAAAAADDNDENDFILLRCEETKKGNHHHFDLLATEGVAPYKTTVQAERTSTLKSKNAPCTQADFDVVLFAILRGQSLPAWKDVEVIAAVDAETSITLTIRKRTQGITQRLGTISLEHDEEQAIELFEWCASAVQRTHVIQGELASLAAQSATQQSTIATLTRQLEELLAAKQEHEHRLLEKVTLLLNEKKLKIRDQQRLLAAAKIDPKRLAQIQATRRPSSVKAPPKSPRNKRKTLVTDEGESAESDAFDPLEAEDHVADDSSEDEGTTDPDETASEADAEADDPRPFKRQANIGGTATKEPDPPPTRAGPAKLIDDPPESQPSTATLPHEEDLTNTIPPPRHLPFPAAAGKKAAPVLPPSHRPSSGADDETDSDDDEL